MSQTVPRTLPTLPTLAALLWLASACGGGSDARDAANAASPATARASSTTATPADAAARPDFSGPPLCSDTAELRAIAACAPGRVRRAGDTLVLAITGGRPPVRLVNNLGEGEQYVLFRLAGTVVGGRYYVIGGVGYEWTFTTLVDASSGERTQVAAAPVPSPDGAHLAAASRSLEIAENATRLEIWRVTPAGGAGKLEREFELVPYDQIDTRRGWGPGDPVWRGADTLVVPRFFPDSTRPDGEVPGDTALVVRDGDGWRLVARER